MVISVSDSKLLGFAILGHWKICWERWISSLVRSLRNFVGVKCGSRVILSKSCWNSRFDNEEDEEEDDAARDLRGGLDLEHLDIIATKSDINLTFEFRLYKAHNPKLSLLPCFYCMFAFVVVVVVAAAAVVVVVGTSVPCFIERQDEDGSDFEASEAVSCHFDQASCQFRRTNDESWSTNVNHD